MFNYVFKEVLGISKCLDHVESNYRQQICIAIGIIPFGMRSMFTTWVAPALAHFRSENSPLGRAPTKQEFLWILSIYFLGIFFGGLFGGILIHKRGPRSVLLLTAFLLGPPWILIAFAFNVHTILVGRFLAGLAESLAVQAAMVYCNEISTGGRAMEKLDFLIVSYNISAASFVLLVNPHVSYQVSAIMCSVQPLIMFLLLLMVPESPYFLMRIGDFEAARISMRRVASVEMSHYLLSSPVRALRQRVEQDAVDPITVRQLLLGAKYRNAVFVVVGLKSLQHMSGITAITGYMADIINLTSSMFEWQASSLIFGGILLPAVIVGGSVIRIFGRRVLICTSTLWAGVALSAEGAYFFVQDHLRRDTAAIAWLPTSALAAFLFCYYLGMGSALNLTCSELFPPRARVHVLGAMTTMDGLVAFLVSGVYKTVSEEVGVYMVMWFYATQCVIGAVFALVFLPETKGKRDVADIHSRMYKAVVMSEHLVADGVAAKR